ncbi:hypothetical protein NUSPORA_00328 [Nucleospora cyclopteri]
MNILELSKRITEGEILKEIEIKYICDKVSEILICEPNVVCISSPICIFGDIHGQFDDLIEMLKLKGNPPETKYLFLGDYVDRGPKSINVILLLYTYKILHPGSIYFIRGNHEQRFINKVYGFYEESRTIYGSDNVWNNVNNTFLYLSIAAIVDKKYFCVHGGISNKVTLNKIVRIDRTEKIKEDGILNDLFWSDPYNLLGCSPNQRGSGVLFGCDAVKSFLMKNHLEMIIRSHQLVADGFRFDHEGLCLTVWSAPNYMERINNPGCILYVEPSKPITANSMLIFKRPLNKNR